MFDPITEQLIADTPDLKNLKSSELVKLLTSASIEIAASRLLTERGDTLPDNLKIIRSDMNRLADVFEAQVALNVNNERLRSMAFVSGSARQVVNRIDAMLSHEDQPSRLDNDCIGPDIAAALLFLASERPSDAAEVGRSIRASGEENALRRHLILTIRRFAQGQFVDIVRTESAGMDSKPIDFGSEDLISTATDLMYRDLLHSIALVAKVAIGERDLDMLEEAYFKIERVKSLAISSSASFDKEHETPLSAKTTFPGPHHLASLLRVAAEAAATNFLITTPTPAGVTTDAWQKWISKEAKRAPLTWENHKKAIATNFLDLGTSMVMTTPTGTGKSTLSALKIAATLIDNKTVLYLAPTHTLISQIEHDLNERLSGLAVAQSIDDQTFDGSMDQLPDIAVMTPEKCLAMLAFAPNLFGNVGLLVFDEFHLMGAAVDESHSNGLRADRRSIDAMLCFLNFAAVNENADYLLLSAMVSNGEEVKEWLHKITGRPTVSFDYGWKPTRQLRGCVVYSEKDLRKLNKKLNSNHTDVPEATPYGLFSLTSNWLPQAITSKNLKQLSGAPFPLGIGKSQSGSRRWVTSNRNKVAAEMASNLAKHGLKILVFCETIRMVVATAATINAKFDEFNRKFNADQNGWRTTTIEEMGNEDAIYDSGGKIAAVHHGELLTSERRLAESLFRSQVNGVNVLVTTSTLAQGLNLPCDVVILAGTDRIEPETEKRKDMQEHEILNALGRAGRAGHASTGLTLVIPGTPIQCNMKYFNAQDHQIASIVLSGEDRCIPLRDPLCTLLDEIEVTARKEPEIEYLARKLSVTLKPNEDGTTQFEILTKRSFGYFARYKKNAEEAKIWLTGRKSQLEFLLADSEPNTPATWQQTLAAKTGASVRFILKLEGNLAEAPWKSSRALDWSLWILEQFDPKEDDFHSFFRPESLEKILGRAYKSKKNPEEKVEVALLGIRKFLIDWFAGKSLKEMEGTITGFIAENEGDVRRRTKPNPRGQYARRFSIRFASELSFLMSTLVQVTSEIERTTGVTCSPMPEFLPQLVRFGFPTPYHYALSSDLSTTARVKIFRKYSQTAENIKEEAQDNWDTVRQKVSRRRFNLEKSVAELKEMVSELKN